MINKQPHILAKVLTERGAELNRFYMQKRQIDRLFVNQQHSLGVERPVTLSGIVHGKFVKVDKYDGQVFIRESGEAIMLEDLKQDSYQHYNKKAVGNISNEGAASVSISEHFDTIGLFGGEIVNMGQTVSLRPHLIKEDSPMRESLIEKFGLDSDVGEFYIHTPRISGVEWDSSADRAFLSMDLFFEALILRELSLSSLEDIEVSVRPMTKKERKTIGQGRADLGVLNGAVIVITLEDGSKIEEPLQPKDLSLTLKTLISEQLGKAPSMNGEERKAVLKEADMLLDLLSEDSGILSSFLSEL